VPVTVSKELLLENSKEGVSMEIYKVEYIRYEKGVGVKMFKKEVSKKELIELLKNEMVTVRYAKKIRI